MSTFEALYLESSISTSTSGVRSSTSIISTFTRQFQLTRTPFLYGIYTASCRSLTFECPSTLLLDFPHQLHFILQGKSICFFQKTWAQQIHLILNLMPQPINKSENSWGYLPHTLLLYSLYIILLCTPLQSTTSILNYSCF